MAESKGFEPLECLRIQRFSRRLHSPPVPPKTPRIRDPVLVLWAFVASLRVPIMATFMAKRHRMNSVVGEGSVAGQRSHPRGPGGLTSDGEVAQIGSLEGRAFTARLLVSAAHSLE